MRDLSEGIQKLTALLAFRIEKLAGKRGWAMKVESYRQTTANGQTLHLCGVRVHLPRGEAGNFTPREAPEADGLSWRIDIKRSDGVARKSFADGLVVAQRDNTHVLYRRVGDQVPPGSAPLSDQDIESFLDDLAKPGPSGVSLWIRKVWGMRFGPMSVDVSSRLEAIRDVSKLDEIHGVVLRATDKAEAEASVFSGT